MPTLDPNELALTIIDQAHAIRRMGEEIERLRAEAAERQREAEAPAEPPAER